MRVVLLEDEHLLNKNITEFLTLKGFAVESYLDGGVLLEESNFEVDIAILDIGVPGASGYEVIEWLKRVNEEIPVIFITAYTDIESIEKGYILGCSDYLKKPFDLVELYLRIKNLTQSDTKHIKISENISFDNEKELLYVDSQVCKLTKIQRAILKVLIAHPNTIVTYEMLMSEVWSDNYIKVNTIASHVKELRKFLSPQLLESVRAEGYRLHI